MELPIAKGSEQKYLPERMCPVCKRKGLHEPNSFAFMSGGAIEELGSEDLTRSPLGFLEIGWHGAHEDEGGTGEHPEKGGVITIAEDVLGGQYELYFCSTKCLREFLNSCVDLLERKISA